MVIIRPFHRSRNRLVLERIDKGYHVQELKQVGTLKFAEI